MSERGQIIIIWWALVFLVIFMLAWIFLLQMMPPPAATLLPSEVAAFYSEKSFSIKLGAMIASWTSAFMVPYAAVAAVQLSRFEEGVPIWSILTFAGGILMSIFLVLPPIFWGVAAFSADRAPEVTVIVNELANLTLTTTDQFYIFMMVPMVYVSLTREHDEFSAFPRWLGYFTAWSALVFEVGALAFMFKSGPFAWDGILVFWVPLLTFTVWVLVSCYVMLRAIKRQAAASIAE